MSNKKRQKAGVRAKQETMRRAREEGGQAYERETSGIDEVLRRKAEGNDAGAARETVEQVMLRAELTGEELDPRIVQLFADFRRYRILIVVMLVIAFGILAAAMYLYSNGTIGEEMQNNLIIFSGVITLIMIVIVFGRVRPIREDINAYNKVNDIALAKSRGAHGASEADVDKIFYQRSRNKRVPPTPEFKRIRRVWYVLMVGGSLLILAAIVLSRTSMDDVTVPVVLIIVSFVLLLAATIIERVKMKPLREAWLAQLDKKVNEAAKKKRKSQGR